MPKRPIDSHEVPFSQIELIAAVCKALGRQTNVAFRGCELMTLPRQMNAIINAADSILAELARPYRPSSPGIGFMNWIGTDDRGLSSEFMARYLLGHNQPEVHFPRDADDFGRCLKMLEACPDLAESAPKVGNASTEWTLLVEEWATLEQLYATDRSECSKRIEILIKRAAVIEEQRTKNEERPPAPQL